MAAPQAVAKRGGAWAQLLVRELVQGDVIALKGGDVIPADCRVRCKLGTQIPSAQITYFQPLSTTT